MNDLSQCYEILGLHSGASQQEIKQAYRDMAMVWHPDRFPAGSRLQEKAQQKMAEINVAYQKLQTSGGSNAQGSPPRKPPPPPPPPQPPPPPRQEPKSEPTSIECPSCGRSNGLTEIYCQVCGHELASSVPCGHCKDTVPANAVYCPSCGIKLR